MHWGSSQLHTNTRRGENFHHEREGKNTSSWNHLLINYKIKTPRQPAIMPTGRFRSENDIHVVYYDNVINEYTKYKLIWQIQYEISKYTINNIFEWESRLIDCQVTTRRVYFIIRTHSFSQHMHKLQPYKYHIGTRFIVLMFTFFAFSPLRVLHRWFYPVLLLDKRVDVVMKSKCQREIYVVDGKAFVSGCTKKCGSNVKLWGTVWNSSWVFFFSSGMWIGDGIFFV